MERLMPQNELDLLMSSGLIQTEEEHFRHHPIVEKMMKEQHISKEEAIKQYKRKYCYCEPQRYYLMSEYGDMEMTWDKTKEAMDLLDSGHYYAASLIAFTLPEVCGRADAVLHPDKYDNIREEKGECFYRRWFDLNVTKYFGTLKKDPKRSPICINGYLAYKLRCQLVHRKTQALDDIPNQNSSRWMKEYDKVNLSFNGPAEKTEIIIDENKNEISFKIGLTQMCRQLLRAEEATYRQTEDKSIFLTDID